MRNAGILNQVKAAVVKENYLDTLRAIDPELVETAVSGQRFQQCFFENCQTKKSKPSCAVLLADFLCRAVRCPPGTEPYFFDDTALPAFLVRRSVSTIPTVQISAIATNASRKLIPGMRQSPSSH